MNLAIVRERDLLKAENERLRANAEEDARLRQVCLELRDEARQENKRLRAALKEIADEPMGYPAEGLVDELQAIARRALEQS